MRKAVLSLALLLTLRAGAAGLADEAARKLEQKDFKGALGIYRQLLHQSPDDTRLLISASLAAQGAGQLDVAQQFLEHGHQRAPQDWQVDERLILIYQAEGSTTQAEALSNELVKLWGSKRSADLSKQIHFMRDQMNNNNELYDVYQTFDASTAPSHHLFDFVNIDTSEHPQCIYYVEQSPLDKRYEFGMLEPGKNLYYGSAKDKPTYEDSLGVFMKVWAGRLLPSARPPLVMPSGNPFK